jgi:protein TonB
MISLRDMSLLTQAGWLAVLAAGFLAFLGLLGLRFQRRGSARFWTAPAALALCLLPLATGAAFAGLILRHVLTGMALTGSGGAAAVAAGTAESLTPLWVGMGAALGLTACAFVMTAAGTSRSSVPASGGLAGWILLCAALVSLVLTCVVVAVDLWLAASLNALTLDPGTAPAKLGVSLVGGIGLTIGTLALALAGAFLAPRGPSPLGMKIASLAVLALCGLLCLAGTGAIWARSETLVVTAMTGVPEGALPEPAPTPVFVEPLEPAPPPPPPAPPPGPTRASVRDSAPPDTRPKGARADSPPRVQAVRVGGSIPEPRKIKNVPPIYPDIAKQAHVQGIVILEATIGPRGDVTSVKVLRGIPLLDQAAIDAVRQWVYTPTLQNGVPVAVIMTVTVNYKLAPQ